MNTETQPPKFNRNPKTLWRVWVFGSEEKWVPTQRTADSTGQAKKMRVTLKDDSCACLVRETTTFEAVEP